MTKSLRNNIEEYQISKNEKEIKNYRHLETVGAANVEMFLQIFSQIYHDCTVFMTITNIIKRKKVFN